MAALAALTTRMHEHCMLPMPQLGLRIWLLFTTHQHRCLFCTHDKSGVWHQVPRMTFTLHTGV